MSLAELGIDVNVTSQVVELIIDGELWDVEEATLTIYGPEPDFYEDGMAPFSLRPRREPPIAPGDP